jgi:hypothetical protein
MTTVHPAMGPYDSGPSDPVTRQPSTVRAHGSVLAGSCRRRVAPLRRSARYLVPHSARACFWDTCFASLAFRFSFTERPGFFVEPDGFDFVAINEAYEAEHFPRARLHAGAVGYRWRGAARSHRRIEERSDGSVSHHAQRLPHSSASQRRDAECGGRRSSHGLDTRGTRAYPALPHRRARRTEPSGTRDAWLVSAQPLPHAGVDAVSL